MPNQILTEKDLESLFSSKKKRSKNNPFLKTIYSVLIFVFLSIAIFVAVNNKSLSQIYGFWYDTQFNSEETASVSETASNKSNVSVNENVFGKKPSDLKQIEDSAISISSLKIDAPVIWQVPNQPADTKEALSKGVVHLKGTALPGEKGNVFITGHSSNYPWAKGNYNQIFALINKLVIGDSIQIKYQGKDYMYKVSDSKVVNPDDVSVLKQTDSSVLSLMTCTPVGTSLRRLIVIAKQTYPDPIHNVPPTGIEQSANLPKSVR